MTDFARIPQGALGLSLAVTVSALVTVGVDEVFPLACRLRSGNPRLIEYVETPQKQNSHSTMTLDFVPPT